MIKSGQKNLNELVKRERNFNLIEHAHFFVLKGGVLFETE